MARPDPEGIIDIDGSIFVAHPFSSGADTHKHRFQRADAIQTRMMINGRCCVICKEPIPIHRQANALYCERRGSCARMVDNLKRRTVKRLNRSAVEIRAMHKRLVDGELRGTARRSAYTTIMLWLEFKGPNVQPKPSSFWGDHPMRRFRRN